MLTPLECLAARIDNPWLVDYSAKDFYKSTLNYHQQYKSHQEVIISTPNKVDFLAQFIAATSLNLEVFLLDHAGQNYHISSREQNYPSIMIPTGGSSGEVKFTQHTWQTLTASTEGFSAYFATPSINALCLLPLYHVSGLMQAIRTLITGGKLLICDYNQLKKELPQDRDYSDYFISLVPTQLKYILEHYPTWLRQFKTVLLGGAPAWNSLLEAARINKIPLSLTYGMTETASQIASLKPDDFLKGNNSSGQILPHAKVRIEDEEGKLLLSPEVGTIIIESTSLYLGYYPSITLSPLITDDLGYRPTNPLENLQLSRGFITDDLGYFDSNGYLYIVGRKSQKIITGGEKVYPTEVERVLLNTGLVEDVAVIGYPDDYWGEIVVAIYVTQQTVKPPDQLKAAIAPFLTPYKQPKKWLEVAQIPRTAQGKVSKPLLEEIVRERGVL